MDTSTLKRLALTALGSLAAACSGVVGATEAGPPLRAPGELPGADECAAAEPHLAFPMRRMDPEEYVAVYSALVGRDMAGELGASGMLGAQGGGLRNDAAAGITTDAVDAMLADSRVVAAALRTPEAAERYDACLAEDAPDRACVQRFVEALAQVAHRRPPTAEEVAGYMRTYDRDASAPDAPEYVVQRVLLAPETFYRPELGSGAGSLRVLTGPELATRLSFMLTGQPPSAPLLAAADAGELDDAEGRRAWAEGLIWDGDEARPAARAHIGKLFFDWLQLGELAQRQGSEAAPDLPERWRDETMAFVEEVIFERRGGIEMLLDGGFAMVDETLAETYGEPFDGAEGDTLRAVQSDTRRGLLQQGAFLGRTWAEDRTIIHRGVYVNDRILCAHPGEPDPEAVANFRSSGMGSERERMQELEATPACATCHETINAIGYTFGSFGAFGEPRAEDYFGAAVETAAYVPSVEGSVADSTELSAALAHNPQVAACSAQWTFSFAAGRKLHEADTTEACQLRSMVAVPGTLDQLLELVASDAFTHNLITDGDSQ